MLAILAVLDDRERDFFTSLYRQYRAGMWKYACSIVHDQLLADDIVQASFLKLLDKADTLERINEEYKVRAYIAITVRNTAINLLRRRRELPVEFMEISVSDTSPLVDIYNSLPDVSHDAVILKYVYGLGNREIGRVLGIGEEAAKKRVQRGVKAIREEEREG